MFYKKIVLKNFTKFRGKHLCQSFVFTKVAGLFFKIGVLKYFSIITINTSWRLLLSIKSKN